jgi:hypothetical protein
MPGTEPAVITNRKGTPMFNKLVGTAVLLAALPLATLTTAAASAASLGTPAPSAKQAAMVQCKGGAASCTATVSLAGGASNKRVVIQLPNDRLRLKSARPTSRDLDGSYLISDQRSISRGHQYAFTLNAARAPKGSALKFRFTRPGASKPRIVRCTGSKTLCQARIPIGGGASNRKVVVQLPASDLGLISVQPSNNTLRGAYSLSHQHLRNGHSEYAFTLSAVQAAPRGSHLTLTFSTL